VLEVGLGGGEPGLFDEGKPPSGVLATLLPAAPIAPVPELAIPLPAPPPGPLEAAPAAPPVPAAAPPPAAPAAAPPPAAPPAAATAPTMGAKISEPKPRQMHNFYET
jgi:hypothetical protein